MAALQNGYGTGTLSTRDAVLTVGAGTTLTVRGDFNIEVGATVHNAGTISVSGSWSNLGDFSDRTGIVVLDGARSALRVTTRSTTLRSRLRR